MAFETNFSMTMLSIKSAFLSGLTLAGLYGFISDLSPGCGRPVPGNSVPGGQSLTFVILSDGRERSYNLYLPQAYKSQIPTSVILSFHGQGRDAKEQEILSQFSDPLFNRYAIAIYPQGINNTWETNPHAPSDISDVQFTSDLLDHILDSYCVDPTRIYASGKSNGGGLVGKLACDSTMASRIAAFAPVAAAFYKNLIGECNPGRADIPILEFHGQYDDVIPYEGGMRHNQPLFPIPVWLQDWASRDGCEGSMANVTVPLYDGVVKRSSWKCSGKTAIVAGYYTHDLGHTWPSTAPNLDNKTGHTVYNATPIIMEFFKSHPLSRPEEL